MLLKDGDHFVAVLVYLAEIVGNFFGTHFPKEVSQRSIFRMPRRIVVPMAVVFSASVRRSVAYVERIREPLDSGYSRFIVW